MKCRSKHHHIRTPDAVFSELIDNTDGTFTLAEKDGTVHEFSGSLLTRTTDRNGNRTFFFYASGGRISSIVKDPNSQTTTFAYGINGKLESITDPAGRITRFEVDERGDLIKVTYPDNTFEEFTYTNHLLTDHVDERQNKTTHHYDGHARLRMVDLPDGSRRILESSMSRLIGDGAAVRGKTASEKGPLNIFTDARGGIRTARLDANGVIKEATDEEGRTTEHEREIGRAHV